jgi:hypothetical protein
MFDFDFPDLRDLQAAFYGPKDWESIPIIGWRSTSVIARPRIGWYGTWDI